MNKHLLVLIAGSFLSHLTSFAQCSFTPVIVAPSGTNVCANSVTLTVNPPSDAWVQKTNFAGNTRLEPAGFSLGNKGYLGLGANQDDLWEYDPATGAWTQKASYPVLFSDYHRAFTIGSRAFVVAKSGVLEIMYEYLPASNSWTLKASPGVGRLEPFAFSTSTKGYLGGGVDVFGTVYFNDFWEYDPAANTWTQKANYGGGVRSNAFGFGIGTKGYVGSGYNGSSMQSDFWEYDPATNTWTQKTNFPLVGGGDPVTYTMNNKGYVLKPNSFFVSNFVEYDPATNLWTAKTSFTNMGSYNEVAGFSLGSRLYFGGGSSQDVFEYNFPYTYSWSTGATTNSTSASGSATYSVSVTDILGCTATASRAMLINPYPRVVISEGNVCAGSSVTLSASGATSYTWSANAGGATSASVQVSPASSTAYTVNATGPGPCTVSVVRPLSVNALPSASIAGSSSVCGTAITLTAHPTGNSWTQKTNVGGGGRWRGTGFSIGSKGYTGMGLNSSFMPMNDLWEYDPATNAWTQKSNFPGSVATPMAFSIGNKAYVINVNAIPNNFWEYDPAANTWTAKANFPTQLSDGVAFTIGNRGYVGTGDTGFSTLTANFWEYDPYTDTWTQRASYPGGARAEAFGMSIGPKGYIGGGRNASFSQMFDVWEYTPTSDSWIQKANLPGFNSSMLNSFTIGNKGYVNPAQVGGLYEFDPAANTWSATNATFGGTLRGYAVAFSIGGKAYAGTGSGPGTYYDDFWEYEPPASFVWSNGSTTVTSTATLSGTYSVTITSSLGCKNSASKSLSIHPVPVITTTASAASVCMGGTTALSAGGAATYAWSDGITNGVSFSPTLTAAYTVTGTAATGCTSTAVRSVTVNALPNVTANASSSVVCTPNSVTLSGGGASTYTWTGGISNGVAFSPTATASYTVTGTASTGCSNTAVASVTVNNTPTVTASASQSVICRTTSITLNGGGASTYTWTGGVTNGVAFSPTLTATYTVTGASAANCTNSAVQSVTVHALPVLTVHVSAPAICMGATTNLQATGATTYTWTGGISNNVAFSPGSTASYTVTGTDLNSCSNTAVAGVTVHPLPAVNANASHSVVCAGTQVTLSASGADTYTWSGGISNAVPFTPGSTADYTVTGTHTLTGCSNTAARSITVNSVPSVTANTTHTAICMNNTVTLSGSGAVTYTWTGGVTDGAPFSPTSTASYTVTGGSAANCTNSAVKTITVYSLPNLTVNVSKPVICFGATTSIQGSGAATYSWTGGITNATPFSPATSGTYTLTGTSSDNCVNTAVASITVNPLPPVTVNASNTFICIGTSVTLSGSGASTYTWVNSISNGVAFAPGATASYTVQGTDAVTGCSNTAVKTVTVNNLPTVTANVSHPVICRNDLTTLSGSGATTYTWTGGAPNAVAFSPTVTQTYTVTGTDLNACTNTAVASVTVHALPNVGANSSASVVCNGDLVVLSGSGASTYTWTWGITDGQPFSPSGTISYMVTGFDLNNCFNTAVVSITVNPLPNVTASTNHSVVCSGNNVTVNGGGAITYTWSHGVSNGIAFVPPITDAYTVTGTDANGCNNTAAVTVTVNALPPVTANASQPVICLNHTTSLSGGGALTYTWSGGISNGAVFSPTLTDTYTVTGTDANGCMNSATQLITVNPLPPVTANVSSQDICQNDVVFFTGGGASIYSWSGGVLDGAPATPLLTDTYTVTGTDANTCTNTAVISVTVKPAPAVGATVSASVICLGDFTTLNGTGAVSYTWSGIATDGIPFYPTSTDTYTVEGTGTNGCTNRAAVTVTVNPLPTVTASATHSVICLNYTTSLSGAGAITYTWSGGVTNGTPFAPPLTDTYTVTGTDSKGCKNSAVKTITVNSLPAITGTASKPVICKGESTSLAGGGAITYTWSPNVSNGIPFSPTTTITYTVAGSDAKTCSNTAVVTVTVNNTPTVTASSSASFICIGGATSLHGGGAVTYTWAGGFSNGGSFNPGATSSYTVTGTSADGCTNTAVTTVTVNSLPLVTASVTTSTVCAGNTVIFNGGGAFTYTWTGGVIDGSGFIPFSTADYTVTGTDLNGCSNSASLSVTVYSLPVIGATVTKAVICYGESVTLNGSGAASYTWSGGVSDGAPFSPTITTTYTLTGGSNGCTSANNAVITVTVNALPIVTVNSGSICAGGSFSIIPAGASNYTYSGGSFVSPASTTIYSITGISPEGCVNNPPALSTVFVHALPQVNISSPQNTLCAGSSGSLQASGASTYTWNTGTSTAGFVISPSVTTSYSVTGTDIHSCTNGHSILITVVPVPTLSLEADRLEICRGREVRLSAAGADTYSWSSGETAMSITKSPGNTITYSLTGTTGAFCSETKTVTITVNAPPILHAGPDAEIQPGESYVMNASAIGASTFKWESEEGLSNPGILNPSVLLDHDQNYTLTATSSKGCSVKDEIFVRVSGGLFIADYMSPNGDGKNDTWKITGLHIVKDYSVEIVDGWGKTVFRKENAYNNEFDAQDLPEGVVYYFIKDGSSVKYKGSITITR